MHIFPADDSHAIGLRLDKAGEHAGTSRVLTKPREMREDTERTTTKKKEWSAGGNNRLFFGNKQMVVEKDNEEEDMIKAAGKGPCLDNAYRYNYIKLCSQS